MKLVTTYDRSELILASIDNLKHTLIEELVVVGLVILIFLWHVPSALIPIVTIPIAVLISFVPMHAMGMSSNIMSLGGIAIAVGAMVDAAIVVVEQTHKKLEGARPRLDGGATTTRAIVDAVKEVGGTSFFALLVIAVSFLPVLHAGSAGGPAVQAAGVHQEFRHGRGGGAGDHARPGAAALLLPQGQLPHSRDCSAGSSTPSWWARSTPEEKHPISRILMRLYEPVVAWSLRWKWLVIAGALATGRGHRSGVSEAGQRIHAAAG